MIPSMVNEVENGFVLVSIISMHGRKCQNQGNISRPILRLTDVVAFHFIIHLGGPRLGKLVICCINSGGLQVDVQAIMES